MLVDGSLARDARFDSRQGALTQNSGPKSQESAFETEASREILRPKQGLRMTGLEEKAQRRLLLSREQILDRLLHHLPADF